MDDQLDGRVLPHEFRRDGVDQEGHVVGDDHHDARGTLVDDADGGGSGFTGFSEVAVRESALAEVDRCVSGSVLEREMLEVVLYEFFP
ncbi:hypothetical protein MN0502_22190 [Arthrobacter sp. MN05-02]|nr:hypothetical protein MN0502_22190 [Arthrobacter sp. MN05-02]